MVDFKFMLWHSLMRRAANQYRNDRIQKSLLAAMRAEHSTDWRTQLIIDLRMNIAHNKAHALYVRAQELYEGKRPWNDFTK